MKTPVSIRVLACLFSAGFGFCLSGTSAPIRPEEWQELATLKGHTLCVFWLIFSPDGKTIASASNDKTVRLWDVASRKEIRTLAGHTRHVTHIAFSPDGKTLVSGGHDDTIRLWDVSSGDNTAIFKERLTPVGSMAYSPDGKTVAVSAGNGIVLFDPEKKKERSRTTLKWGGRSLTYRPDGKLFTFGMKRYGSYLVGEISDQEPASFETDVTHFPTCFAFSPDCKTFAAAFLDNTVRLWDVATGKSLAVHNHPPHDITCLAWSPDGKTLATGYKPKNTNSLAYIHLMDARTGKEITTLKECPAPVMCVAFDPKGRILASACADNTIKLWHLAPKKTEK